MKLVKILKIAMPLQVAKDGVTVLDADANVVASAADPTLGAWIVEAINSCKGSGYTDAPYVEDVTATGALGKGEPVEIKPEPVTVDLTPASAEAAVVDAKG